MNKEKPIFAKKSTKNAPKIRKNENLENQTSLSLAKKCQNHKFHESGTFGG